MVNYMKRIKPKYQQIYVEVTNICNLSCPFCLPTKRQPREMTIDEVSIIAEKIKGYTHSVYLHVKGEPLMHSRLKDIIDVFNSVDIKVKITTNGININNHRDYLLNNAAISKINVSLQSVHNMSSEFIHQYFNELKDFVENANTHIYLRNWALNQDLRRPLEMELKRIFPNASFHEGELLSSYVHYSVQEKFEWPSIDSKECEKSNCLGGRNQIAILSDGTVVLCCLDTNGDNDLGNIFTTSLEEIITSNKYLDAVNKMPYLELCKKCSYRLRFKK